MNILYNHEGQGFDLEAHPGSDTERDFELLLLAGSLPTPYKDHQTYSDGGKDRYSSGYSSWTVPNSVFFPYPPTAPLRDDDPVHTDEEDEDPPLGLT